MYYFYIMKNTWIVCVVFILFSCKENVSIATIEKINGYWQIEKVIPSEGEKKEYSVNENYEYFELKNKVGFHKKVRWQPMGTFLVDDLQEKVEVVSSKDAVVLRFSSPFGKHQEIVEELTDSLLVLESERGDAFYYKKVNVTKLPQYGKKAE